MDNTLELAGRLPDLQCLKTGFSRISGAGIVHLQQLTSLTSLTMEVQPACTARHAHGGVFSLGWACWAGQDSIQGRQGFVGAAGGLGGAASGILGAGHAATIPTLDLHGPVPCPAAGPACGLHGTRCRGGADGGCGSSRRMWGMQRWGCWGP